MPKSLRVGKLTFDTMENSNQINSKDNSTDEPKLINAIKKSFDNYELNHNKNESYLSRFKKLLANKIGGTFR